VLLYYKVSLCYIYLNIYAFIDVLSTSSLVSDIMIDHKSKKPKIEHLKLPRQCVHFLPSVSLACSHKIPMPMSSNIFSTYSDIQVIKADLILYLTIYNKICPPLFRQIKSLHISITMITVLFPIHNSHSKHHIHHNIC